MSIRFRKDRKKYEVDVSLNGKRIPRRQFQTKREAQDWENQMRLKAQGVIPSIEPTLIGVGFLKYNTEISPGKDPGTCTNEKRWLRIASICLAEQGLQYIHEVRLDHMEELQRWLQKDHELIYRLPPKDGEAEGKLVKESFKGLKPQTVNRWHSTFRHVFKKMRQWKRHLENPCEFLAVLEEQEVHRQRWTESAVLDVFRASPAWFKPVFRAAYYYGARPSSLERLTWDRVDFLKGEITLDSKKGARAKMKYFSVPMNPPMRRALLRIKKQWPLCGGTLHVFRDDKGNRLTADRISKTGSVLIKSCGYDVDFYELKHTLADDLRIAGVTMDQVAEVFGHSDTRSTKRYSNSLPMNHMASNLSRVRAGGSGQQNT